MRSRDPYFDNAKFVLVTLVVVGHSWTMLPSNTTQQWLYDFLYAWHVPAFVLVTGYLSRSFTWHPDKLWSLVRTVAVPYFIFEAALAAFRHLVGGVDFKDLWADPHWPMWYLSALFFWRLATPVLLRIPAPVTVAVALSLAGGMWAGDIADAARIFGLLPFFVVGLKMRPEHWQLVRAPRTRLFAVGAMVTLFAIARFAHDWIPSEWLYYRSRYHILESSLGDAFMIRLILLLVGATGAFAFFALVPRGRTWFSTLGTATLVVYLCHGFFVLTPRYSGFLGWAEDHFVAGLLLTTFGAIALAITLATPPVARRLSVLTDPIGALEARSAEWRSRVPAHRASSGPAPDASGPVPVLVGDQVAHPAQRERHQEVAAHADRSERRHDPGVGGHPGEPAGDRERLAIVLAQVRRPGA